MNMVLSADCMNSRDCSVSLQLPRQQESTSCSFRPIKTDGNDQIDSDIVISVIIRSVIHKGVCK